MRTAIGFCVCTIIACGPTDPCVELSEIVCDGGDADYCQKVDKFLDARLIDPDGKPLKGPAREQMCSAVMGSIEVMGAYRFKARQEILGEPFLDLSKQARDARLEALKTPEQKAADAAKKAADEKKAADKRAARKAANGTKAVGKQAVNARPAS